jgi:hypothetical protein
MKFRLELSALSGTDSNRLLSVASNTEGVDAATHPAQQRAVRRKETYDLPLHICFQSSKAAASALSKPGAKVILSRCFSVSLPLAHKKIPESSIALRDST